jgi:hypothetical protein
MEPWPFSPSGYVFSKFWSSKSDVAFFLEGSQEQIDELLNAIVNPFDIVIPSIKTLYFSLDVFNSPAIFLHGVLDVSKPTQLSDLLIASMKLSFGYPVVLDFVQSKHISYLSAFSTCLENFASLSERKITDKRPFTREGERLKQSILNTRKIWAYESCCTEYDSYVEFWFAIKNLLFFFESQPISEQNSAKYEGFSNLILQWFDEV